MRKCCYYPQREAVNQCYLLKAFLTETRLCKNLNCQIFSNADQGVEGLSITLAVNSNIFDNNIIGSKMF